MANELFNGVHALLGDPAVRAAWDRLVEHHPERRLSPGSTLEGDLGLDSMGRLHLVLQIERTSGARLSDASIQRIATVRDLLAEIRRAPLMRCRPRAMMVFGRFHGLSQHSCSSLRCASGSPSKETCSTRGIAVAGFVPAVLAMAAALTVTSSPWRLGMPEGLPVGRQGGSVGQIR